MWPPKPWLQTGWPVRVAATRSRRVGWPETPLSLRRAWTGAVDASERGPWSLQPGELIIDALFGAGLDRELDNAVQSVLRAAERSGGGPLVAVDLPIRAERRHRAADGSRRSLRAHGHLPSQESRRMFSCPVADSAARPWLPDIGLADPVDGDRCSRIIRPGAVGRACCPGPPPSRTSTLAASWWWFRAKCGAPAPPACPPAPGLRIGAGLVTVLSPARRPGRQRRPSWRR